jgi:hypothetical protein
MEKVPEHVDCKYHDYYWLSNHSNSYHLPMSFPTREVRQNHVLQSAIYLCMCCFVLSCGLLLRECPAKHELIRFECKDGQWL